MFKHFNWFFLAACVFFSLWQFSRYRHKTEMVKIAEERIQEVIDFDRLKSDFLDDLQEFNLVRGMLTTPVQTFQIKRKVGDELFFKRYGLFPVGDGNFLVVGQGCSKQGENPDAPTHWLALRIPSYNRLFIQIVNTLVPPTEISFLDKTLLSKKLNIEQKQIFDLYLEPVNDDFTVHNLFAFDFSRSEIFFGFRKAEKVSDPYCFKPLAPPSLHLSYVFEWIFIGVVGFALLTLIKKRFYSSLIRNS